MEQEEIFKLLEEYKNIFQNSQVGIMRTEMSTGKLVKANVRAAEIWVFQSPEDRRGRLATELFTNPTERQASAAEISKKGEIRNYELHLQRRDGTDFWIE